jgi:zinc D-Ala-D-Ala dipeptidase
MDRQLRFRPALQNASRRNRLALALMLVIPWSLSAHSMAEAQSRPASFVDIGAAIPDLVADLRYSGARNFVGEKIDGYEQPVCLLTKEAATALAAVQRDLAPKGLGLKVFDCYRPVRAVTHFMRWAKNIADIRTKKEFYPEMDKRNLFRDGYLSSRSAHSRGSTVDLTLVRLADKGELDMGTPYDFFSQRSWPSDTQIGAEAQANRKILAGAMRARGFRPYEKEWWHFTLRNEPFPDTYFDFPVR